MAASATTPPCRYSAAGLRAVALPTVILSNTPHYPTLHGGAVPLDWFQGLLRGLDERGVTAVARVVVCGYLGQPGGPTCWRTG